MINPENDRNLHKLILSLNHKLSPSVYFISSNTEKLRKYLYDNITSGAPRFKHLLIDLTPHSVYSLRDAINQFVPDEVRSSAALTYVVHFTGISSSLFTSENGEFKKSMLLEELNFERETLFQDYPFISFLWVNPFFYKELFWKAGDLMSWAFDRYEFTDESPEGVTHEIPYKEPLQKQGAIAERTERIKELEDLLDRLDEQDQDQQKVMLQKINAQLLLGREYMAAFRWAEAEDYLLKAKYIIDKIAPGTYQQFKTLFYLGDLYREIRQFDKAISCYECSLSISKKVRGTLVGVTYHQIGMVYFYQRRWQEALSNFFKAIEWKEKTGDIYNLGSTYHQIGYGYAEQHRWEEALFNYSKALEWKEVTGNKSDLGNTYHQIGMVYADQQRWKEALIYYNTAIEIDKKTGNEYGVGGTYHEIGYSYQAQGRYEEALINYNQALQWKQKLGNEYELGNSYNQIGNVYAAQERWDEALANYFDAIEWKEKTGNKYELGGTYHQIGIVYEKQGLFRKAKEYFEMAVENLRKYNHSFFSVAEISLERIKTKLAAEKAHNNET